jgi:hypothetical protein
MIALILLAGYLAGTMVLFPASGLYCISEDIALGWAFWFTFGWPVAVPIEIYRSLKKGN